MPASHAPRWYSLLNTLAEPRPLSIEVASTLQLPAFLLVGLAGREVNEARERVRAALQASGFELPRRRIVVNLSPASLPKQGTGLDLAIALAILTTGESASGEGPCFAWGELALDGRIRPCGQILRAYAAAAASKARVFLFSQDELPSAIAARALLESVQASTPLPALLPVSTLSEAARIWREQTKPSLPAPALSMARDSSASSLGLGRLPRHEETWMGVAASGGFSVLLLGPKGVGKSHALDWLSRLVPPASPTVRLTRALLEDLDSRPGAATPSDYRSVRRVSPQVKAATLLGGYRADGALRPGELTLAHGGALIADEFPEWPRDARECLREPLERGAYELVRAGGRERLPSQFQLLASGNLCPCGNSGSRPRLRSEPDDPGAAHCRCGPETLATYRKRLSGPLLDRIDFVRRAKAVSFVQLALERSEESADAQFDRLRARVIATHERLHATWGSSPSHWGPEELWAFQKESHAAEDLNAPPSGEDGSAWRQRRRYLRLLAGLSAWKREQKPSSASREQVKSWLTRRSHWENA